MLLNLALVDQRLGTGLMDLKLAGLYDRSREPYDFYPLNDNKVPILQEGTSIFNAKIST